MNQALAAHDWDEHHVVSHSAFDSDDKQIFKLKFGISRGS